jgi:NAD(P)-dependent dehydrogenase (short-subunit alcohol dehydrogenase family)
MAFVDLGRLTCRVVTEMTVNAPVQIASPRLDGKRAIVSGASSGIGRATAERFGREGARVGLIDVNQRAGREVASGIVTSGGIGRFLRADVTVEEEVAAAVEAVSSDWGGLDIVVANAGAFFGQDDRADRLDSEIWKRTLDVNLTGIFLTCKYGIKALLASGGGSVVCTASPTGFIGSAPGCDAYSSSKAGVFGLVRVMASDYAPESIRVNAVVPGFTDTPLVREVMANDVERNALLEKIPLRRPGTADEVASMILFLASDESSYATGGAFFVDGGLTAV